MENYVQKMKRDKQKLKKKSALYEEGESMIYKCEKLLKMFLLTEAIEQNNGEGETRIIGKYNNDLIGENLDEFEMTDDEEMG